MSYLKNNFKSGDILYASQLNNMDDKIEENTNSIDSLKEEITNISSLQNDIISLKADKTSLATTDRKLNALLKLNQGVSYQFEEDSAEAYQKTVPTGAKLASVKSIGGKTIVWNQLDAGLKVYSGVSGSVRIVDEILEYTVEKVSMTNAQRVDNYTSFVKDHTYLFSCWARQKQENENAVINVCIYDPDLHASTGIGAECALSTQMKKYAWIIKVNGTTITQSDLRYGLYAKTGGNVGDVYEFAKPQFFDLTKMFGSGNEPSTVEEFETMFPGESYPYNSGELFSAGVNEIVAHGRNLIDARKVVSRSGDITFENLGNGKIHVYGSTDTRSEIDEIYVDKKDFPVGQYRINNTGNSGISVTLVKKDKVTGTKTWCNDKFTITDNDIALYWYIMAVKCTVDIVITPQITRGNSELPALVYHDPTSFAVPETVRQLPGYGWSAGNIYNEIDFENKKYIQRVAAIDLGKLTFAQYDPANHTKHTWYAKVSNMRPASAKLTCAKYTLHSWISMNDKTFLQGIIQSHPSLSFIYISDDDYTNTSDFTKAANGVMLYYELAEPIVTDISDLIDDSFLESIEVESGGTLTFQNSHGDGFKIPVPNKEEYMIKLSEVIE